MRTFIQELLKFFPFLVILPVFIAGHQNLTKQNMKFERRLFFLRREYTHNLLLFYLDQHLVQFVPSLQHRRAVDRLVGVGSPKSVQGGKALYEDDDAGAPSDNRSCSKMLAPSPAPPSLMTPRLFRWPWQQQAAEPPNTSVA